MSESKMRASKIDNYFRKQVYNKLVDLMEILEPSGSSWNVYTYSELLEETAKALYAERLLTTGE